MNEACVKQKYSPNIQKQTLATCNMVCGRPQLWPLPTKRLKYSKRSVSFLLQQVHLLTDADEPLKLLINSAFAIFYEQIAKTVQRSTIDIQHEDINKINVKIAILSNASSDLRLETDESYLLTVQRIENDIFANISAETYFGARHGLETLSQLIWWDEFEYGGMLKILYGVKIEDAPKFPYRGLMIDVARNFFPLDMIKAAVDGMSASKLNVLHLHLTDAQSFPLVLPGLEKLAYYGAYSANMTYTKKDIKNLIEYAKVRGVRVVLEVDAPSHVNSGWEEFAQDSGLGKLVLCTESTFSGQLNPDNVNALNVMEEIYSELLNLTGDNQVFHIGGDEVDLDCWRTNSESAKNAFYLTHFWANYTSALIERLGNANRGLYPENIVIWSSPLTESEYIETLSAHQNIAVQFWYGNQRQFLSKGFKVIYSTVGHWYLDCGFNRWRPGMFSGVCDPYTPWQSFYEYRPWIYDNSLNQTLGGEVCLWTEQVEVDTFETRLWPRTAAFAERVWSDPPVMDNYDVYTRLATHSERLKARGLKVSAMWPRWCTQNPGKC